MACLKMNRNMSIHLEQRQKKPLGHSIKIIEVLSTFTQVECKRLKFLCWGDSNQKILKQNTFPYTEMS